MQKRFKQLMLLAAFVPTFAMAQALQTQTPNPADTSTAAAAPVDPAKQAAIKDLLDAIDAQKLVGAIGNSAQMQAKQLVPAILSDALSENKTMTDKQKQASVPTLQKNAVPKLVDCGRPGLRNGRLPSGRNASSVRRLREVLHRRRKSRI